MNYNMKSAVYLLGLAVLFFSCHGEDGEYDATGVFETTEVIVSARKPWMPKWSWAILIPCNSR